MAGPWGGGAILKTPLATAPRDVPKVLRADTRSTPGRPEVHPETSQITARRTPRRIR